MDRMLSVQGVCKRFGAVTACDRVNLQVGAGTCTAIVGPNGAGKSTLLNIVCGEVLADDGLVFWQGACLVGFQPQQIARTGVARMSQDLRLFDSLSVYENLFVAARATSRERQRRHPGFLPDRRATADLACETLERLGLAAKANRKAADLP